MVRARGLTYDEAVLTIRGDGLPSFLAGLAADWRWWEGTRSWATIEHALTIEATHHGDRVGLLFIVRPDPESDAWEREALEIRLPLVVAPGESLSHIAKAGKVLFEGSPD